ncbi:calcium-binding protein [Mesobacterium pallidum]|uniref:calcium-binding protein n=1 Tax=Mesobacterium pallidum TaxID=2872037 RepID=UPI001EE2B1A5|nr:calcium-binding protein [Mesobacterium pallidum]
MAIINHSTTINGVADFTAPDGSVISWDGSTYLEFAGMWSSSVDTVTSNVTLSGSNWQIEAMRYHSTAEHTNISDANGLTGRRIEYLKLGQNSDIDLISTRVKFLVTQEGGALHDVTLGSEWTGYVELAAASNILTTGSGWVETIRTRGDDTVTIGAGGARIVASHEGTDTLTVNGRLGTAELSGGTKTVTVGTDGQIDTIEIGQAAATVTLNGAGRINYLKSNDGSLMLTTGSQYMESFNSWNTTNTIVNNGGMGMVEMNTNGSFSQNITSNAWLGSLVVRDNQATTLMLNDHSGFAQLGDVADTVTQTAGWADHIATRSGWDNVTINGEGVETLYLGDGWDTAMINGFVATMNAGNGDDMVTANGGGTTLRMGDGNDLLTIGALNVQLATGDDGNDTIIGGDGGVGYMRGNAGDDRLEMGSGGVRHIEGGSGNDRAVMAATPGDYGVTVNGGDGADWIDFSAIAVEVTFSLDTNGSWQNYGAPGGAADAAGIGFVTAWGVENIVGSNQVDLLTGDAGNNIIEGRIGLDTLYGLDGNDTIYGHKGHDLVLGNDGADELWGNIGQDSLVGGKGSDTLYGNDMDDYLGGNLGNDVLYGGTGRDRLEGGEHDDLIYGGAGADDFRFNSATGNDTIGDFEQGLDKLRLYGHDGGFGSLGFSTSGDDLIVAHSEGTITLAGLAGIVLTQADITF